MPDTAAPLLHTSAVNDYDIEAIRRDFPILSRRVHGKPLVYLDTANSAQKPQAVIDAVSRLYAEDYANVHRGLHSLSMATTDLFEAAREKVRAFVNAASDKEIVFTRGGTASINLVANSFGRSLGPGDEVIISHLEHHSNIVPWQMLRDDRGVTLKVIPMHEDGSLDLDAYADLLTENTELVAVTHMSNALGTIVPIKEMAAQAHAVGAKMLVDGCQSIMHMPIDVQDLDCDFFVFSGHKLYGPSGIGVLYGKRDLLDAMPPYQGGGDMIKTVTFEKTVYADLPAKHEAGTPPIAQAVGLGAAIDYLTGIGMDRVAAHEADVSAYAAERLQAVPGLTLVGTAPERMAVVSFTLDCAHPHDIGTLVDLDGVAVRAGHHCAQPVMQRLDLPATVRASFGMYTSRAEIDVLARALETVRKMFA